MVTFAVGVWNVVDDKWVLESCPAGYAPSDLGDACVVSSSSSLLLSSLELSDTTIYEP